MALFNNERPLLIDLDRQIVGTLVDIPENKTDKDFVFPSFVPLNSIKVKHYRTPVPITAIYEHMAKTNDDGVEKIVYYICEGTDDSVQKFIKKTDKDELERLRAKLNSMRTSLAITSQERDDATQGVSKTMKSLREVGRKPQEEDKTTMPFGRSIDDW